VPSPTISHSSPAICILNAELMIMNSEVACAIRALLPEFAHMPKHPFIHDPTDVIASRIMGPAPTADRTLGSAPTYPGLDGSLAAPEKRRSSGSKFHFWYIGELLED
jgi:hypothetical protein